MHHRIMPILTGLGLLLTVAVLLAPRPAAAVAVQITYGITGGSVIQGVLAGNPITNGTLVATFPNAVSLYNSPSGAGMNINTLRLTTASGQTAYILNFASPQLSSYNSVTPSFDTGFICCGTVTTGFAGLGTLGAPTLTTPLLAAVYFLAFGPASAPRTFLTGAFSFTVPFGQWTFTGAEISRAVPEPGTGSLLAAGLVGLVGLAVGARARRKRSQ